MGGCCHLLCQPGGPTGDWCLQPRIVKSSTAGINENIIFFEGMIDSTEIPIDFFCLSNDLYYMHNRAAHYCQGTWGWISWCWQVCSQHTALFFWDVLEVWIELPAEMCHSSLWRWPWKKLGGVWVQHKPCSERWNGTRAACSTSVSY